MSINLNQVPFDEIGQTVRGLMPKGSKSACTIVVLLSVGAVGGYFLYKHLKKKNDEQQKEK